jgi:signal transduction histidine kinase
MRIERAIVDDAVDEVFTQVRSGLAQTGSTLVADDQVEDELHEQVAYLIGSVFAELGFLVEDHLGGLDHRGTGVGAARAGQHIHPAESLMAARLLFASGLPTIARATQRAGHPLPVESVALTLSAQVFRMMGAAAVAYVEVLFNRITAVQREERASVARDLHDRVAHTLASGLLKLDLAETQAPDPDAAATRAEARQLLGQALGEAQAIAMELRQITGSHALLESVHLYLAEAGIEDVAVDVSTTGEPHVLSEATCDQVFLLVREALRNSFAHAGASTVGVRLDWGQRRLTVTVWDDGRGFRPLRIRPGAMGLVGMRERAELIGASFALDSTPDAGTRVIVEVPYAKD